MGLSSCPHVFSWTLRGKVVMNLTQQTDIACTCSQIVISLAFTFMVFQSFSWPPFLREWCRVQQPYEDSKYVTTKRFLGYFLWLHTMMWPGKFGYVFIPHRSWTTSGKHARGCSQQELPRQSFVRHWKSQLSIVRRDILIKAKLILWFLNMKSWQIWKAPQTNICAECKRTFLYSLNRITTCHACLR